MLSVRKLTVWLSGAAGLVSLTFLPFVSSSQEHADSDIFQMNNNDKIQKMNSKLSSEIALHGFLFWASMGFLTPIGILAMRMSHGEQHARRRKVIFYSHATSQIIAVLLATTGAIRSIRKFENSFNNIHQRIGLVLYFLVWLQALTGISRPLRGTKGRTLWYLVHWLLGSMVSCLGVINIYTGLQAYQKKTSRSSRMWTIVFITEIAFIIFLYLLQERQEYIQKQGTRAANDEDCSPTDKQKEVSSEPC